MFTRIKQFMLFATLGVVLSGAFSGTAQAELCDSTVKICIVNPPTAANPWIVPQLVQLRLPSEADPTYSRAYWSQPGVFYGEYPRGLKSGLEGIQLVEQGPPGGTSVYQGPITAEFGVREQTAVGKPTNVFLPSDGVLTLTVEAVTKEDSHINATFTNLPVLGAVAGFNWHIVRKNQWYKAIMSFDARSPVNITQLFHITGYSKGEADIGHNFVTRRVTGIGPQQIVQKLSKSYVERKCEGFSRCELVAEGTVDGEILWAPTKKLPDFK